MLFFNLEIFMEQTSRDSASRGSDPGPRDRTRQDGEKGNAEPGTKSNAAVRYGPGPPGRTCRRWTGLGC